MAHKGVTVESAEHPEREARAERVAQTGKYDRKAIRARLDLEQWLDERLASVMGDDADAVDELEIDLDEVLEADKGERAALLKNVLSGASDEAKVDAFVDELLGKLEAFSKQYGSSLQAPKSRGSLE